MSHCSNCNHPLDNIENRCPQCGSLNSKIDNILANEAAEAEKKTLKGRLKIIVQAKNKKQALLSQIDLIEQSLSKEILFALFISLVFIFAMTSTVL